MLMTTALTFLMHPSSLIVMAILLSGWGYVFLIRTTPLVINGRTLRCEGVMGCCRRIRMPCPTACTLRAAALHANASYLVCGK